MHELNVNNCQPTQGPMVAIITFIIWSISRYLDQIDTTCQSQHKARILPKQNQTLVIRRSRDLSTYFLPNTSLMGLYTLLPFILLPTSLKAGIVWSHLWKRNTKFANVFSLFCVTVAEFLKVGKLQEV